VLLKLAAAGAVLALAGCGGSSHDAETTTTSSFPPGCTVAEVDTIVTTFLSHPDYLAPPSFFQVYATTESDGRKFSTRSRSKALSYLRARIALGERMRLLSLRVAPQDVNHVRITFRLTRFAPDFRARAIFTRLTQGAGTIDCAHGRIAAWVQKGP
jgi:hypothetical protein